MFRCRSCNSDQICDTFSLSGFPLAAQHFLDNPNANEDKPITLNIVRCNSCSLVQITNSPVSYYQEVITAASLSETSKKNLIDEWNRIIQVYSIEKGDALEIGSGKGDFLDVLLRLGFKALGLESGLQNIKASLRNGFVVDQGYLTEFNFVKQYQLVVCNNYLEHQPNVGLFVKKIYDILMPDGIIYVSVPNLNYLLEKACLYEFVADHLVYFTKNSLTHLFNIKGFEILEIYEKNNGNDLVLLARKKNKIDYQIIEKKAHQIIKSIKNTIVHYHRQRKRIAIWGAGHRALALMAMANLEEVEIIVDSANFKQGKYSPILHKKIISPEEFFKEEYDVLILMLPGTSNTYVEELVKEKTLGCKILKFNDSEIYPN